MESRTYPVTSEWALDATTFLWILRIFGPFEIDLFATRWNNKLPEFVSPCPDPEATEVNALSLSWNKWNKIYLFPPPNLMPEVLEHLDSFKGQGVLIAPYWPKAPWLVPLLEKDPYPVPLPETYHLW